MDVIVVHVVAKEVFALAILALFVIFVAITQSPSIELVVDDALLCYIVCVCLFEIAECLRRA